MTVVVVYGFQPVHIYKAQHKRLVIFQAVIKHFRGTVYEAVAVIDIAQGVDDIKVVKFLHSLADMA